MSKEDLKLAVKELNEFYDDTEELEDSKELVKEENILIFELLRALKGMSYF